MKKYGIVVLCAMMFCTKGYAESVGLGFSFESYDTSIYVPIKVTKGLIVEPFLTMRDNDTEGGDYPNESEAKGLGVGLFIEKEIRQDIFSYFGGRVAYLESSYKSQDAFGAVEDESDGYRIAPTVGLSYQITEGLYLSGEVEWYRTKMDIELTRGDTREDRTRTSTGTDNRIVIRYYF